METLETLQNKTNDLIAAITAIDSKLDEVREYISGLALPQEQLNAIGAMLDSGKAAAESVLAEADALDEPSPAE